MGSTDLLVIGAIAVGAIMFGPQIMEQIKTMATPPPETPATSGTSGTEAGGAAGGDTSTSTSTTNIYGTPGYPYPVGVGYPVLGGYPYGYLPYAGASPFFPPWPPVLGHFSEPRRFNNWPRWGGWPRPGPRFLGPPVPAPFPHH